MTEAAPWLKSMEHGVLGEARARAFLLDRFWVLERSVDIEGADYLVQQRLTSKNFMDREPPRLGVVQVKFIQDGSTHVSIHKQYAVDQNGHPYNEFFVLVFTGREDKERSFLLSSRDLLRESVEVADGSRTVLRLQGSKLLAASNYEVTNKGRALDRIEHALKTADFMTNRRFLGHFNYIEISQDHIDPDLLLPLDNAYTNIGEHFFNEKKLIQRTLFEIEDVVKALEQMLRSDDPEEHLQLYEERIADLVRPGGWKTEIGFSTEAFRDEDFYTTVRLHRARLAKIRELGVEGAYLKLLDQFNAAILVKLSDATSLASAGAIKLVVTYNGDTMADGAIAMTFEETDKSTPHIAESGKGKQVIYLDIRNSLPKEFFDAALPAKKRAEMLRNHLWKFRRPFQAELDRLFMGEDLVAF